MSRLEQLFEFLRSEPNDPFLKFAIALEYRKGKNHPEALKFFLDLRSSNPNYLATYYQLGKLYEEMADSENAVEAYNSGVKVAETAGDMKTMNELVKAVEAISKQ